MKSINNKTILVEKCRGPRYDGTNTMYGTHGRVQKLIKDIESNTAYVLCAADNLNLILNDAVNKVTVNQQFLETGKQTYNF